MVWFAVAAAVIGAIGGAARGRAQKHVAQANSAVDYANAEGQAKVRLAGNAASAATDALNRWSREVNNGRMVTDIGESLGAQRTNLLRMLDTSQEGLVSAQRQAEQAGAQAAAAALVGVGGSVVDRINAATDLARNIRQEAADRAIASGTAQAEDAIGQTAAQMLRLDTRTQTAQLDFGRSNPQAIGYSSILEGALMGAIGAGTVGQVAQALGGRTKKDDGMRTELAGGVRLRDRNTDAVGGGDLADFAFDRGVRLGDQPYSGVDLRR